jgi:hypothetical protein
MLAIVRNVIRSVRNAQESTKFLQIRKIYAKKRRIYIDHTV